MVLIHLLELPVAHFKPMDLILSGLQLQTQLRIRSIISHLVAQISQMSLSRRSIFPVLETGLMQQLVAFRVIFYFLLIKIKLSVMLGIIV